MGIDINLGSGAAWARNIEIVVQPEFVNSGLTFVMGDEIDLENFDRDCGLGFTGLSMCMDYHLEQAPPINRNWQYGHIVFDGHYSRKPFRLQDYELYHTF